MADPVPNTNTVSTLPVVPPTNSTPPVQVTDGSSIKGVSIRGWIALIVILTICVLAFLKYDVKEPLYTLATVIVGFYFGHQVGKSQAQQQAALDQAGS